MTYKEAKRLLPKWAKCLQLHMDRPNANLQELRDAVRREVSECARGENPITEKQYSDLRSWLSKIPQHSGLSEVTA